ncbi:MAG: TIGR02757 family protein [Desulfobacterales bacterium]|nr:TIGR02757 family protein [Desulfobacterales bacterium]
MRARLDTLYGQYNRKAYIDPDPLLFLYDYKELRDRELAGFIAACLAYGRVELIMKTVGGVLEKLGPEPSATIMNIRKTDLDGMFDGFVYRFARASHLTALISGMQGILERHGSLYACFNEGYSVESNVADGLSCIRREIATAGDVGHLIADPGKNSACKRSHLYLRWMVRQDAVDPGGWTGVSPADLVYPIDTHMYKIGRMLGFTRRKSADRQCAMEITRGFKKLNPEDPVRYDFALTRFGIRRQFDVNDLKRFIKDDPK